MASLDQLYSYDLAIETAWRDTLTTAFAAETFLDSAGQTVAVTAHIEQSDEGKTTPFVDIQLRDVMAKNQQFLFNGVRYYNAWEGHLVSRVVTQRGANSNLQATIIGVTRARGANFADVFNDSALPYHSVQLMRDFGLHRGLVVAQVLDFSEIIYRIDFSIRSTAWG
jgi:hypothetical protein